MTRAQLGRLLASNRQLVQLALREAIAVYAIHVNAGAYPCELRKAFEHLLTELEAPQQ